MTARRAGELAVVGFLGGVVLGAALWSWQMWRYRRSLFSAEPMRRYAALGYLRGAPGVETASLLRDYIEWEPRPSLRRRGEEVLQEIMDRLS